MPVKGVGRLMIKFALLNSTHFDTALSMARDGGHNCRPRGVLVLHLGGIFASGERHSKRHAFMKTARRSSEEGWSDVSRVPETHR